MGYSIYYCHPTCELLTTYANNGNEMPILRCTKFPNDFPNNFLDGQHV